MRVINNNPLALLLVLEGEALEEVESFTYLGSVVDKLGGTDADVKVRIGKARAAFHQLKKVSGSSELPRNTKIRIFNSMVKPIILYGGISNLELWHRTGQQPVEDILRRCWRWVGHTLRKPASSTARHTLFWNPHGKRKRGRPRNSWRRDLDADVKRSGHTWGQLEKLAQDRDARRALVRGICPKLGR